MDYYNQELNKYRTTTTDDEVDNNSESIAETTDNETSDIELDSKDRAFISNDEKSDWSESYSPSSEMSEPYCLSKSISVYDSELQNDYELFPEMLLCKYIQKDIQYVLNKNFTQLRICNRHHMKYLVQHLEKKELLYLLQTIQYCATKSSKFIHKYDIKFVKDDMLKELQRLKIFQNFGKKYQVISKNFEQQLINDFDQFIQTNS